MKNEDQTKQLLQMLVQVLPTLMNSEALGKFGDTLVQFFKQGGELLVQRLDTDAGYAAGMRELAATVKFRTEQVAGRDKIIDDREAELAKLNAQADSAVEKLGRLLVAAKDPTMEMPAAVRQTAIDALTDILKTLGAEDEDEEVVEPPADAAETHRGTAHCAKGHTWSCVWTVVQSIQIDRIVFPPTCPTCGLKWTEVENEPQAEEQPS